MSKKEDLEFKPTHRWKPYPGIFFEVDFEKEIVRGKGRNDLNCTDWSKLTHKGPFWTFKIKGERIFSYELEHYFPEDDENDNDINN